MEAAMPRTGTIAAVRSERRVSARPDYYEALGGRTRVYRALANLLSPTADPDALDDALEALANCSYLEAHPGPLAELRATLAATSLPSLCEECDALLGAPDGHCDAPKDSFRSWACVVALVAPDDRCSTDLLVLAAMNDLLAWKSRVGDAALVKAIDGFRAHFLREHARRCLGALAMTLEARSGLSVFPAVGRALACLLREEPV
jgi:hypothetical protein